MQLHLQIKRAHKSYKASFLLLELMAKLQVCNPKAQRYPVKYQRASFTSDSSGQFFFDCPLDRPSAWQ